FALLAASTATLKTSPSAMPPAVLIRTADRASTSGDGNRTRSEPASRTRCRRVRPSRLRTRSSTVPTARFAANAAGKAVEPDCRMLPPRTKMARMALQGHRPADRGRVEVGAIAAKLDRATIHHGKCVAEFA